MFKNFLKLMGVGLVSGASCRMGSMLADAMFPGGLGGFLSRFNKPRDEKKDQPRSNYLKVWQRD